MQHKFLKRYNEEKVVLERPCHFNNHECNVHCILKSWK